MRIPRMTRAERVFKHTRRFHRRDSLDWLVALRRVYRLRGDAERTAFYTDMIKRVIEVR